VEDVGLSADDGDRHRAGLGGRGRQAHGRHGDEQRAREREHREQLSAGVHGRASPSITLVATPLK
jgi:hypothetical protein